MTRTWPLAATALGLLALSAAPPPAAAADAPSIAVASSLRPVLPAIAARFEAATGERLRLSYASSGKLTRQILRGAPFELFLAADAQYPRRLVVAGRTPGEGTVYAYGRIGLFVPTGSPLAADGRLDDLRAQLAAGRVQRLAIPNPEHAPYGVRARQALRHAKLWEAIQPHLVRGENAAQAAQFAASGSADGGIVPASLALTPRLRAAGRFDPVPGGWYEPLEHRMVLLAGASDTARRFHDFLLSEPARELLRAGGFALPAGAGQP